jgi:hypothetical protein
LHRQDLWSQHRRRDGQEAEVTDVREAGQEAVAVREVTDADIRDRDLIPGLSSTAVKMVQVSDEFLHFRSYSRSRSRSRGRRNNFRGRGGFNARPRFSPKRAPTGGRGRWNNDNNFRDTRDFRGGGRPAERFNRDRPRGGRFGGGRFNRSVSRSPERSPNRNVSPDRRSNDRRNKERDAGRWTEADSVGKPDLEGMEEMLKKARKEKLEALVENNKDLVKERAGY